MSFIVKPSDIELQGKAMNCRVDVPTAIREKDQLCKIFCSLLFHRHLNDSLRVHSQVYKHHPRCSLEAPGKNLGPAELKTKHKQLSLDDLNLAFRSLFCFSTMYCLKMSKKPYFAVSTSALTPPRAGLLVGGSAVGQRALYQPGASSGKTG